MKSIPPLVFDRDSASEADCQAHDRRALLQQALLDACGRYEMDQVRLLVAQGADPNGRGWRDSTRRPGE